MRPVTKQLSQALEQESGDVQLKPPSLEYRTTAPVTGLPPSEAGPAQVSCTADRPTLAMTWVGALGGPRGTAGLEGSDAEPVPIEFVADTVNV